MLSTSTHEFTHGIHTVSATQSRTQFLHANYHKCLQTNFNQIPTEDSQMQAAWWYLLCMKAEAQYTCYRHLIFLTNSISQCSRGSQLQLSLSDFWYVIDHTMLRINQSSRKQIDIAPHVTSESETLCDNDHGCSPQAEHVAFFTLLNNKASLGVTGPRIVTAVCVCPMLLYRVVILRAALTASVAAEYVNSTPCLNVDHLLLTAKHRRHSPRPAHITHIHPHDKLHYKGAHNCPYCTVLHIYCGRCLCSIQSKPKSSDGRRKILYARISYINITYKLTYLRFRLIPS